MTAAAAKQFDYYTDDRLGELALYVSQACQTHSRKGAVKLNKILFMADFSAFLKFGRPISGAIYVRNAQGPVPAKMPEVRKMLVSKGRARELKAPPKAGHSNERRLIPLVTPKMNAFSREELALVDEVIKLFRNYTGSLLSKISHRFPGWDLAKTGEVIPYETAFLPMKPLRLTKAQQDWATAALAAHNA